MLMILWCINKIEIFFIDMIECSYQQHKNKQTMNGQNGQQNENQYKWAQFSSRLGDGERRNDDDRDAVNARFDDVEVSTPRRGATTTRDFERRQLFRATAAAVVVRFHEPAGDDAAADVADETMCEPVERPRTRSARRAADAEAEREANAPAPAPMPKPTMKRVRRNDYWVERDDKRRTSARTFKTVVQQQTGGDTSDEENAE